MNSGRPIKGWNSCVCGVVPTADIRIGGRRNLVAIEPAKNGLGTSLGATSRRTRGQDNETTQGVRGLL
jgi:hypothetical protein